VKGGKTRDIPLPLAVMQQLERYVTQSLPTEVDDIKPDTHSSGLRSASGARA
jgi:hypothetical protein